MTNDEEIIDTAYTKGTIHPQPCGQCGVIECAVCMDEFKKLMSLARQDENKKVMGAKFLDLLRSRATFSEKQMGLSDEELLYEKGRLQGAIERVKAGNGADCDCLERGLMSFCLHDMEAYFAKGAKDEREKHREGCCDCCEDHYADGVKDGIQNERERLSKGERCAECKTLEEALTHKHIHPTHVCTVQNCERERRVVEREKKERLRVAGLFKKIHLDYENKIEKLIMELEI